MAYYYANEKNKPNPAIPYFKQWENVPNGTYLVLRIFKPNQYPSATLCTSAFRVNIPLKEWEKIRVGLLEAYRNGKDLAILAKSGEWTVFDCEDFGVTYLPNEYGVSASDYDEDCTFIPLNSAELPPTQEVDADNPF